MTPEAIHAIEIELLLEAIVRRYGYDFRHYARGSLHRRVTRAMASAGVDRVSEFQSRILHDPTAFELLLQCMSVSVTSMFRDPVFFRALREKVIPVLKTYPFVNIWHAGCATGEEAYSMAILLIEEGIAERSRIYATDYNAASIESAKLGIYSATALRECTPRYRAGGGTVSLADYYHAGYDGVGFHSSLRNMVTFARHNLVGDGVFGEMQLIVCRNVLIYFDANLQGRVLSLFHDSLCPHGFLALGDKESLRAFENDSGFERLLAPGQLYRAGALDETEHIRTRSPYTAADDSRRAYP